MSNHRAASSSPAAVNTRPGEALVPRWFQRTVAWSVGALAVGAVVAVLGWIALQLALLTVALIVALMLAALLEPLARLLHRVVPTWAAAALAVLALLAVLGGTGYLLEQRIRGQFANLAVALAASVDRVRDWLITGPLTLAPRQVNDVRNQILAAVRAAAPSGDAAASTVISLLTGIVVALFVLFFLLRDGRGMWARLVELAPAGHRERVGAAGRGAWETLSRYVRGVVLIALADAVLIGIGLFALGVPLALSLTLLVFLGAFVPLVGATVSGAVAVLVALVTRGPVTALIVLGVVLVVQNVEGNILQPFIQSRAVRLHPVTILVAVTAGILLYGVAGAVVAVPLVAVVLRVVTDLRSEVDPGPSDTADDARSDRRAAGGVEEESGQPDAPSPVSGRRLG